MFAKPSEFGGGAFFKPADHMNDLAILIEPKRIDKGVQSTYNNQTRLRDEVTADITIFGTEESLAKGEPTRVIKSGKVVHGMLTSTLERIIDGAMVAIVRKIPTQAGQGYVFRDVDPAVEAKVGDYYTKRNAEVEANLADVPDFD